METKLQELDGKLRTLKFTLGKSEQEIKTRNLEVIARHEASIKGKIEASHALKDDIIELKFGQKQTEEQVQEWLVDIEGTLKTADEKLLELKRIKENIAKENQAVELAESVKQERAIEDEKHEQKMSHERELYEQQLKLQKVLATGQQNQVKKAASTKLPKLSITQFDGKCANWPPFWNKFVAEIDGADLSPVTKFTYLKEFVKPKVRADIDGLPLTVEGYERAKNILKGEYGKTSEIVNACRVWNYLADELNFTKDTSIFVFKSDLLKYYFTSLNINYDPENSRTFKSICLKCNCTRSLLRPISCCS